MVAVQETTGMRVRIGRIRRGLTQEQLARLADVAQYDVSMVERNRLIPEDRHGRILEALNLETEVPG